jgi:MFS family permease
MKIDLVGAKSRGLAMGLNEFAGYLAVAASALATGWLGAEYGLRPYPFYLGVAYVVLGLGLSVMVVRETRQHAAFESKTVGRLPAEHTPSQREVFWRTTISDHNLSSISQAGLVNNLNDGMAWGLFPIFFATAHMRLNQIGILAAIYPATWGVGQLFTGAWSDRVGRKWLIASGMWTQAVGIGVVILIPTFAGFAIGASLLGIGTAMVYPTLLAAIGDVAHPSWRASSVGVYRFWRDLGYAIGALVAGVTADALGVSAAIWLVAAMTLASGLLVAARMTETLRRDGGAGSRPDHPTKRGENHGTHGEHRRARSEGQGHVSPGRNESTRRLSFRNGPGHGRTPRLRAIRPRQDSERGDRFLRWRRLLLRTGRSEIG